MAGNEPKLADAQSLPEFPLLRLSVQGEKGDVSTRPSTEFASKHALRPLSMALPSVPSDAQTFRTYLHDLILRAAMSDHPLSSQDVRDVSTLARENFVGVRGKGVDDIDLSLAHVGVGGKGVHDTDFSLA